MHNCNYEEVNQYEEKSVNDGLPKKKFLYRQLFICSGVCSLQLVLGLCFGAPTVLIPQVRREVNSTIVISDDMASWISSVHGYSAPPWVFIVAITARLIGRKIPIIIISINTLVGYIVFFCSTSAMQILTSEIIQGVLLASNITLLDVIVAEYTSPKYRGIILTTKAIMFNWGVWIANITGTFSHWRNIGIVAFVLIAYSTTAFTWPESPFWLAMQGRFEECAASHRWLKGTSKESEEELENLIKSQKEYLQMKVRQIPKPICSWSQITYVAGIVSTRRFYMPLMLSITVMSLYHFSGKFVCGMYSIQLIQQITENESAAYTGMLILEAVTIAGMHIGSVLSKVLKRRTLLLGSTFIGIMFLFIISAYLYLIYFNVITENKIVFILLLTLFSVTISSGPMVIFSSVYSELTPLRYKSSTLPLLTLYSEILMATLLKFSPFIFKTLLVPGTFLFFAITASILLIILYKYLPETKDKTLQEIEDYFKEPEKNVIKETIDKGSEISRSSFLGDSKP